MKFEEPKVEFVEVDSTEDIIVTSSGASQYMCSGSSSNEECSDANMF